MDTTSNINNGDDPSNDGVTNLIKDKRTELHGVIDKAANATQPAVDRIAASAHTGVDQVSTAISDVSDTLIERTRQLNEAYQHLTETGRSYVRTSPVLSVAMALAAGYALSKLFGSRAK